MYRAEFRGSVWILMDGSTRVGPAFAGKQEAKRYAQAHNDLVPTGSEPSLSREGDTVTARTVVEFIPESPSGDGLKPLKVDVPTGEPTKAKDEDMDKPVVHGHKRPAKPKKKPRKPVKKQRPRG